MYRRRRLLVLVLAALVVALVAFGAVRLVTALSGDDDAGPGATGSATPDPSPSTTPSPTPSPTPTNQATPPLPTSCTSQQAQLEIEAPASATAGGRVDVRVSVRTTADATCLVDLGSEHLVVEVFSGEDLVWSTAQCPFTPTSRDLLLGPDSTDDQAVPWSGRRSAEGCPDDAPVAEAGAYRVVATATRDGAELTAERALTLE
ncbi:conserved hypothetical protein [Beutenbergia cavernae DSM 12333]|uniref:DUF4232 domain-containing protein n=1 Tax=Beutenbergia cavernae (strain ATCC BAA-8 / DSM 12333 / CCUG 43141 / JCM 11478 / NBRC 16432 / NCIMB 13614 / HKI 0122) TaxID=471853 RepID=C5C1B4_BEUC1|nr:conserved hypothetical protein [Beutenbergia cavernae DSM 12333]